MSSDLALSVLRRLRREPSADTPLEVLARNRWRRHREIADTTGPCLRLFHLPKIEAGELSGGAVVVAVHAGPYDQLPETFAAIERWIEAQGLRPAGAPWESYLTDPAGRLARRGLLADCEMRGRRRLVRRAEL